ncbi:hypothetical protein [Nesterenkonia aerolata]|uniref:Uncharacterized protein n=1 Tax=Nesterenkonia aerolata TaxID=3074079 RepID=A0ABU2DSN3_9MICC|nr:hypothetical protein [Nesterenkonia sp. LY-0111]MDR8019416.1 hypothetical protein [Nesterenkonia sp. LY-0111]
MADFLSGDWSVFHLLAWLAATVVLPALLWAWVAALNYRGAQQMKYRKNIKEMLNE